MGIEPLLLVTIVVAAVTGGGWTAARILDRYHDRLNALHEALEVEKQRVNSLDHRVDQLPVDYVLKADFVREIESMHDNFRVIHDKLDKMLEMLLTR